MTKSADTFERSCDHWSESGRQEMENFYALASVDYRHLTEALDWKSWLETRQKEVGLRSMRLLDVACGSGKFPSSLVSHGHISGSEISPVDYALLDPSTFSISEAKQALAYPFRAGAEYKMTLQDLECQPGSFDIVWATHALYAIPEKELKKALEQFLHAMGHRNKSSNHGTGFIAHANSQSHYLQFYQHYLNGFKSGTGEPFVSSEQISAALTQMGVTFETKQIEYTNGLPQTEERQVEGYLQRCLFDDTLSLKDMLTNPVTGPYLEMCRKNGPWEFAQHVSMIFVNSSTDLVVR